MYVMPNYKTKKALREAVAAGEYVSVFSPGPFDCPQDGRVSVEGPHGVHRWYATVEVREGIVVKVN